MGIQEMKVSRVKVLKLIHGYDSTGRGGKIRIGIRNELATMPGMKLQKEGANEYENNYQSRYVM